jgi:hypothetical protein
LGVSLGVMIRLGTLQITPEILNLIAGLDEFKEGMAEAGIPPNAKISMSASAC